MTHAVSRRLTRGVTCTLRRRFPPHRFQLFLSLGKEKIFTEELMTSVSPADETALTPSQAGFILTKESGSANIIFGLRDGKLAVSGINY